MRKRLARKHPILRRLENCYRFLHNNLPLVLLLCLGLIGVIFGVSVFRTLRSEATSSILPFLTLQEWDVNSFSAATLSVFRLFFGQALFPIVLFLLGMTAFGCPL